MLIFGCADRVLPSKLWFTYSFGKKFDSPQKRRKEDAFALASLRTLRLCGEYLHSLQAAPAWESDQQSRLHTRRFHPAVGLMYVLLKAIFQHVQITTSVT